MDEDSRIEAGQDVVRHDSPTMRQRLQLADWIGLDDIKKTEEEEGEQDGSPGRRDEKKGQPLTADFVDDDLAGVLLMEFARKMRRGENAEKKEN